jgi:spore coat protein U-like protein
MRRSNRPGLVRPAILSMAAFCAISGSNPANATTTTTSFSVSLTISATCTINSAGTLTFTAGTLAANTNATSSIAVLCTNTTPYNIGLNAGTTTGGTTTTRLLTNGTTTVSYKLYSNAGFSTNWGNTVGTDTVSSTGTGSAQTFTVYGQVPAQTSVAPGTYTDTITVTVTY